MGGRSTHRFPRSAPFGLFVASIFTLIGLLFLLNATSLKRRLSGKNHDSFFPDEDLQGAPQDLPDLITYIRQLHLKSPDSGSYKLHAPNTTDFSQNGQSKAIAKIFENMRDGVFVEAGAYNGEELSNSLYLERELGWSGLLVEPDPWNFWSLRNRGRKSYAIQACLSPIPFPREVTFRQSDTMGHIAGSAETGGILTRVKCFPLYSLLLSFNASTVHLLSLDLEGVELQVLRTVPWEKVDIRVILVEFLHIPEGVAALVNFMRSKGYSLYSTLGDDQIYIRKDSFPTQNQNT